MSLILVVLGHPPPLFCKFNLFESDRKREQDLPCTGHAPDDHNWQGWARLKGGPQNFFCVSHMGTRGQRAWVIFTAFPGAAAGSWHLGWHSDVGCQQQEWRHLTVPQCRVPCDLEPQCVCAASEHTSGPQDTLKGRQGTSRPAGGALTAPWRGDLGRPASIVAAFLPEDLPVLQPGSSHMP